MLTQGPISKHDSYLAVGGIKDNDAIVLPASGLSRLARPTPTFL